jgi:hypothetical protein
MCFLPQHTGLASRIKAFAEEPSRDRRRPSAFGGLPDLAGLATACIFLSDNFQLEIGRDPEIDGLPRII